jgi:hypothetical protein
MVDPSRSDSRSISSPTSYSGCAASSVSPPAVADRYANDLVESLGTAARRPLSLPPPSPSFVADDHTPVEFSLSFRSGADPALHVLLEPGSAFDDLAENGRHGRRAVRAMARRWGYLCDRLDVLEDLFFPADPQGPSRSGARWSCARAEPPS